MRNGSLQASSWKTLIRNGGTPPATGAPVVPKIPPGTPVEPGIEPRFRSLAQQIKADPDYNQSIGNALGIVGPEQAGPDYATLKPIFVRLGGCVHIHERRRRLALFFGLPLPIPYELEASLFTGFGGPPWFLLLLVSVCVVLFVVQRPRTRTAV